jgi:nucleotide-binding universal stress UspA family protein
MSLNHVNSSAPKTGILIPTEVTLSRTLGLFTITMIGVGGMIGAGIFVLTGIAAGIAGPGLVLVFLLNGVVALFTGMVYAEVIDPLVDDPPIDVAVVRYRARRPLRTILVPVAGGRNSRLAVKLAVSMAGLGEDGPVKLTLLNIVPEGAGPAERVRAQQFLDEAATGLPAVGIERRIVEGSDVVETILAQAAGYDLIVIGASEEPLFRNLLMGSIPEQIAQRAAVTVIMVKRRSGVVHSFLRQTVLEPSTKSDAANDWRENRAWA